MLRPVDGAVPLSTLLSWTWVAFAIEADNAVEALGRGRVGRLFRISLAMWTNALRLVDDDGITVDELGARAGARTNLGGLERWGWLAIGDAGAPRVGFGTSKGIKGDTVLRPTRAGVYARKLWPGVVAGVEDRWNSRFGGAAISALRAALPLVEGPWSPPEVHASDGFMTHVIAGTTADVDLPLPAMLGRALTAMTIDYENGARVSLPLVANVLRVLDGDAVARRDLPARSGVSKEAIAMAVRFATSHGLVEDAEAVTLTPRGRAVLAARQPSDDQPLRGALESVLSQREALVEGLVPPTGCWRGEKPHLAQTQRILADPTGALPWHPMVLHRGGWPDGS
jgi:hypothetical protein